MQRSTVDEGVQASGTKPQRSTLVWALVLIVAGLGASTVVLESGLAGQFVPSYESSSLDFQTYEKMFDAQALCSPSGLSALPEVRCTPFDDHGGLVYPAAMTMLALLGAALIFRWANSFGWLLIAGPLIDLAGAASVAYATRGSIIQPGSLPGSRLIALVGAITWVILLVIIVPRILMTLPNGRFRSVRWKKAAILTYVAASALIVISLLHPLLIGGIPNPIGAGWTVEAANSLFDIAILGMIASWALGGIALVFRTLMSARSRFLT